MIIINPTDRVFQLDSTFVTAKQIYAAWADWLIVSDNMKYPQAFRTVGGDDTTAGQKVPGYYFLMNGWKIRPIESDQSLTVDGFLYTDDGSSPVLHTVGVYNVQVTFTVPALAVAYSTSGTPAPTVSEIIAGMIAAGFVPGTLSQEEHDQLMNKVATRNDIIALT